MTEEATQKEGVSEEPETGTPKEPVKSRRDLAYEAIIASREAEKTGTTPVEEEVEDNPPVVPEEPPMLEFEFNGETIKVPASAKYRAKIDGEDVDVDVENITRSYQKGAAADKRLEEATRKAREAEDKALQLAAKETELTEKEKAFVEKMEAAKTAVDDGDLSEDDYQESAKAFIESLSGDDESEMVSKVAKVFAKLQKAPPAIDEDALLSKAEERALKRIEARDSQKDRERQLKEQQEANSFFKSEFKDIVSDARLMGAAKSEAATVMAEHPGFSQREVAKEVGRRIREWAGTMKAPAAPPKTPKAASVRASVGKDKPPQGRQAVFNEMRVARGQPNL